MEKKLKEIFSGKTSVIRKSLRGADLSGIDWYRTELCQVDLRGADLRGAEISEEDLREIKAYYESYEPAERVKPLFDEGE